MNTDVVPSVAELPTCQKMLAALAPPLRMTWRPVVVVRVEAIWKMNTAFASPWASSVRSPDEISSDEVGSIEAGCQGLAAEISGDGDRTDGASGRVVVGGRQIELRLRRDGRSPA